MTTNEIDEKSFGYACRLFESGDLDKIPAEEIDQDTIKDNCYASYISEKKDNESYNNANVNNILISLSNVVIVTLFLSLLNKKYK